MDGIVVTDDELKCLERRFGPCVRRMGWWCSDGTFGYSSIPVIAVRRAAGDLEDPNLRIALTRLDNPAERTKPFIELLETFGLPLVEKIVTAYRELAGFPDSVASSTAVENPAQAVGCDNPSLAQTEANADLGLFRRHPEQPRESGWMRGATESGPAPLTEIRLLCTTANPMQLPE